MKCQFIYSKSECMSSFFSWIKAVLGWSFYQLFGKILYKIGGLFPERKR